ncbi:NAD(P)H-dependent oxidoreductase [Streptomyces sp. NPDC095613]|uniref:NAD(P)H-dependent oxidoreductase n=1 Tax=Streptomyces sp. NPDC095613 TaxID=3155540 RepID=UPI0033199F86
MRRVEAADEIVVIFPVWWYGLPALLKGWVDAGISRYCGVEDATARVAYDTIDNGADALEAAEAALDDFLAAPVGA